MNDDGAMNDEVTLRLSIRGRVQGVWFRESMRREAGRLAVRGWVCNRLDGSVEAVVQGPRTAVDEIVRWARRGPEEARVSGVEVAEADGDFSGFEKKPGY
jgi:acylphosphatase